MNNLLLARRNVLSPRDLVGYNEQLGLDVDGFSDELGDYRIPNRIADDVGEPAAATSLTRAPFRQQPTPPPRPTTSAV